MTELDPLNHLVSRIDTLLDRVEKFMPETAARTDWSAHAFRWRKRGSRGYLQPIKKPHPIAFTDLHEVDRQRDEIDRNTRQFVNGLPANNVLLTGSRGTGKSSLIKAMLTRYAVEGLRLIEVDKVDLVDLPDIVVDLDVRPERFIIFCDDLSFEGDEFSYKALKAVLDGSVSAPPENVLIYATSNRRHLMPEYMRENLDARSVDGEIHHGEAVEEKVSLSERFGLWLSFYPFNQDAYLEIVGYWVEALGDDAGEHPEMRAEALKWALTRGSRSGRSAYQFARDWVGRNGLRGD